MTYCKLLCALSIAIFCSTCIAQDITDVEAKPYGSYTGGTIDTVDLASGNLMLNIPLVSFPQKGSLPPLSFSVELNNAPYSQMTVYCDPYGNCMQPSSRYDTSPPGAAYQYLFSGPAVAGQEFKMQNVGAYLTSSFAGGIVTGQYASKTDGSGLTSMTELLYTLIDPSGTTHELESDVSSLHSSSPSLSSINTYKTPDGSGYMFVPSGNAYDYNDTANSGLGTISTSSYANWLGTPTGVTAGEYFGGVRLGTLYTPTGIKYTSTIDSFPIPSGEVAGAYGVLPPRALTTTEKDPLSNTITRSLWYWSGYQSMVNDPLSEIQNIYSGLPSPSGPYYQDSVNRIIPDVVTMQAMMSSLSTPLLWNVKGPGGENQQYKIWYASVGNFVDTTQPSYAVSSHGTLRDPSYDLYGGGNAISSITLPDGVSQWSFQYSPGPGGLGGSGPDLISVSTPAGGEIDFTYKTITGTGVVGFGRCNALCHAVATRTEKDGLGHSYLTTYDYGTYTDPSQLPSCALHTSTSGSTLYAFWTTETHYQGDATSHGDDTVHSFCAVSDLGSVPMANEYHEIETQYYQGAAPAPMGQGTTATAQLLKTVTTSNFKVQADIIPATSSGSKGVINVLPGQVVTTTPRGSTTEVSQYSNDLNQPLFYAGRVACGGIPCSTYYTIGQSSILSPSTTTTSTLPISYLSPTSETSYSGNVAGAYPLLRTTSTTFEFQNPNPTIAAPYLSANLIALPLTEQVSGTADASSTTTYSYDENNGSPQGAYGNETSKSDSYTMLNYYGSASSGLITSSLTTHTIYNPNGMPVTKIDGNGYATNIHYDGSGLYADYIQRPTTGSVQHFDYYSYDLNTGGLNWHTDENGSAAGDVNHTTTYGYDIMGRVISIQYPGGGGSTFCYTNIGGSLCSQGSAPYSLVTNTVATPDPAVATRHKYDGWGRQVTSSVTSDPLGATIVDTTYDSEGRVASVSNPYRSTPLANDPPPGTTYYTYDALGRKTIQTQPDGSIQQWCYDDIATNGQNNCHPDAESLGFFAPTGWTDVSDETGRHTQQVFDALGRMAAVIEPDPSSGSLSMETDYAYDLFGDLLNVAQAGSSGYTPPTRYFAYDMPSRVRYACNPEAIGFGQSCISGSAMTSYFYDGNSNLTHKTDNRGITTNYTYDALNRLLSKTYSNDSSHTASSCYQYDTLANGSGRLGVQWTQTGACPTSPGSGIQTKSAITAYDAMGRVLSEQRCMGITDCSSGGYAMNYGYDLAGKLISYPSGFGGYTFANTYDAAGRPLSVSGVTASQTTSLFSVPTYTPAGALSGVQLGTYTTMTRTFDSRQRITAETW